MRLTLTLPIRAAVIQWADLHVSTERTAFEQLAACAERYARRGVDALGQIEGVQHARSLFRALGIDPTKTRPSSEALLRRALKHKPLYAVNTLVDAGNWCSLDFLLPLGLYDSEKIVGPATLRRGAPGESYQGIADKTVNVAGRYVLADEQGPFGSPVTDSLRTSISEQTTRAVMIIFAPADYPPELFSAQAATAADRIVQICGGTTLAVTMMQGPADAAGGQGC